MSEMNDWNASIIAEFRKNGGKVGGRFANAPVVLITTEGSEEQTDRGLALGASAYVKKPFRNEELLAVVQRLTAGAPAAT